MKIKKYVVKEMQEAIRLIREDLGPDAVIISSYPLPRRSIREIFSPRQLEVTAALDDTFLPVVNTAGLIPEESPLIERNVLDKMPVKPKSFNIILKEQGRLIMEDLDRWRNLLLDMELQENIVTHLLQGLEIEATESAISRDEFISLLIKKRIASLLEPIYREKERASIYFFIGPTGVGKTLTIAKLATRLVLFEKKKISLIAICDTRWDTGGELKLCADSLGIPLQTVMKPSELISAISNYLGTDLILIDTEGIPSKNFSRVLKLKNFSDAVEQPKEIFLVLSCTTKNRDLFRIATDFEKVGFSKIVFTKLDETETYGSILNVICRVGAPVDYVTCGQSVPDDILPVDPRKLAGLFLKGAEEYRDGAQATF